MTDVLYATAILTRFVHLGSACLLTGIFAFLVFVARPAVRAAGPAARDGFERLDRRLLALAAVTLGVGVGTGLLDLVRQALLASGGSLGGSLTAHTIGILLAETRYGDIWLVRHVLWLLLAALLLLREPEPERDASDWLAVRLCGFLLAAAALAVGAASGHAASAPEGIGRSIGADALHLLATGIWAGALVPFVLFLRWARPRGPDAPPAVAAVVAVRRFSALGLLSVGVILGSGAYAVFQQVGGAPALFGTKYGRWLLLKLALLLPLLAVASINLAYIRPRLQRAAAEPPEGESDATALVARLRWLVRVEAVLVAAMLGVVAVLNLTTPARHDPITWPLPFRLPWETITVLPRPWSRVALGGELAIAGLAMALVAVAVRRGWRRPLFVAGVAALCVGLALALPPLAVDAYPTTYVRPAVAYTAASIVRGHALYREHCESCHGPGGTGAATGGSAPRPVDLTGKRVAEHTAGDLFWWLTHGVRRSTMPGFGQRLSDEQRWDLVNLVRTFSAAETARSLAPTVTPTSTIAAPDFSYTTGIGPERWLHDYRGQIVVLLVFFRLPESRARLSRLANAYFDVRTMGAEIVAVPLERASAVYRELGARPMLFPFAIGGAEDAAAAYRLLRRDRSTDVESPDRSPVHMEMLVDRQGYVRARWLPAGSPDTAGGWNDLRAFLGELARLTNEPGSVPILGEHIH